jgi:hypothetical protein
MWGRLQKQTAAGLGHQSVKVQLCVRWDGSVGMSMLCKMRRLGQYVRDALSYPTISVTNRRPAFSFREEYNCVRRKQISEWFRSLRLPLAKIRYDCEGENQLTSTVNVKTVWSFTSTSHTWFLISGTAASYHLISFTRMFNNRTKVTHTASC